ncbi:hypothetical protein Tco_1548384 [Tanacetum coccineum]
MHTFYQRPKFFPSEHRWTKVLSVVDKSLEILLNQLGSRRQLEIDGNMYLKAMQEEFTQFDQSDVMELVERPLPKMSLTMKWSGKQTDEVMMLYAIEARSL